MKPGHNTTIFFRLSYFIIAVFSLTALIWGWIKCSESGNKDLPAKNNYRTLNVFGFNSDSLEHQTYLVQKNETISDILANFDVTTTQVNKIVEKSEDVLDVRKIIAGKTYHAFTKLDSINSLAYFVYEKNPVNFVVIHIDDSINVYNVEKEIEVKENQKSAIIDQSLYVSLMQSNASPELAIELSQVFAWQIDFYHLQEGDNFKVIYEELYVDGKLFGIGKIKGALFNHKGKDFYAIPFIQDSIYQYFDENGNSLRKAFLKAPLEFGRISSRYSKSRLHPVLRTRMPHYGVDYAAPVGTPIRSTGDGIISEAGYNGGSGRFIKIRHNSVYTTMYLHLSRYAKGIKKDTKVQQGQVIGYVGSSGLSTGPHLDYRFFINGKPVDPLKVEVPPSYPVKENLRSEYEKVRVRTIEQLNKIAINSLKKPV